MSPPQLRGLIVDWGGVLTTGLHDTMSAWAESDGVDYEHFRELLREWLNPANAERHAANPVHQLERGELPAEVFEGQLATRLRTVDGRAIEPKGLLSRIFHGFRPVHAMHDIVRQAKASGIRTCLLSNSWGNSYPRTGWDELFHAVVISGEVGMRKPEPRIYRFAAGQLELEPARCVFVDDLRANVAGATEQGMVAIHHQNPEDTTSELEELFGTRFRDATM